jgi:membrane-associated phospholipid phosphatase
MRGDPDRRRPRCVATLLLVASFCWSVPSLASQETKDTAQRLGDVGQYVPAIVGVALATARRDEAGLGQLALTSATTLALVHTLKPVVHRRRPSGGEYSFPSGHTAIAFAGAGFVHRRYGWWYGIPAYAVSAFVAYSRVHSKAHWTSDVLAGGAIGWTSSLVFTRQRASVTVTAVTEDGGRSMRIAVVW